MQRVNLKASYKWTCFTLLFRTDIGWPADVDGDAFSAHGTVELMHGASVRVLIPRGTDARVASRQLKKLAEWFERKPDELLKLAWQIPEDEQPSIEDDIPF